ncbi:MAG TPA: hypothetical protein PKM48_08320 [Parvularculaceae bacterium]|nr:hypothetical protein [Parvularculaceae bacterium]HNS85438.1 hypothetical protein [Parvularculaceae bacterium]
MRLALSAIIAALAMFLSSAPLGAKEPELATQEEIVAAHAVLVDWTSAFQAGDYRAQWLLTDSRIRRWHDRKRWKGWMTKAARRNGALNSYAIEAASPARAEDLPCTETGHCFRPGVKYVIFLIRSEYEIAAPAQPEFAVMAFSDDGWRFGGGTFLNRPMGETSVIMTVQDERRYKPGFSIRN